MGKGWRKEERCGWMCGFYTRLIRMTMIGGDGGGGGFELRQMLISLIRMLEEETVVIGSLIGIGIEIRISRSRTGTSSWAQHNRRRRSTTDHLLWIYNNFPFNGGSSSTKASKSNGLGTFSDHILTKFVLYVVVETIEDIVHHRMMMMMMMMLFLIPTRGRMIHTGVQRTLTRILIRWTWMHR